MRQTLGERIAIDMQDFHQTVDLLGRVNEEVQRQENIRGKQKHPLISPSQRSLYRSQAAFWKQINDGRAREGHLAWDGIALEELFEALEETDAERAVNELIQAAAVLVSAAKSVQLYGIDGASNG